VEIQGNRLNDLNKDPRVIAAGGANLDFTIMEKGLPSYSISYNDRSGILGSFGGNTITKTVTPKDIINASIVMKTSSGYLSSDSEKSLYKNAKTALESKFGIDAIQVIQAMGLSSGNATGRALPDGEESLIDRNLLKSKGLSDKQIATILNTGTLISSQQFSNTLTAKEEVLKEKMKGNSPVAFSLYPKDAKTAEIESVNSRMNDVLNTYKGSVDVSEFSKFFEGKDKNITVNIGVDRGVPGSPDQKLTLDLFNGESLIKSVPITKTQADYIKAHNLKLPAYVSQLQESIQWSDGKNTSNSKTAYPNDPEAYQTAFYKSHDFTRLGRTDVMGADVIINNMGAPNVYIYVKDGNGRIQGIPFRMPNQVSPYNFTNSDAAGATIEALQSGNIDEIIANATPKTAK
jgi:hypothetical protein